MCVRTRICMRSRPASTSARVVVVVARESLGVPLSLPTVCVAVFSGWRTRFVDEGSFGNSKKIQKYCKRNGGFEVYAGIHF